MKPSTIASVWWSHELLVAIVDTATDVRPVGCDARGASEVRKAEE
jgi:hypothetical protein